MKVSKNQLERLYLPLMHALADADNLVTYCRLRLDARLHEVRKVISARREEDLKKADANHARAISAAEARRDERLRKINEVYATRITEVQTQQQRDLRDAIDAHDRLMADLKAQAEAKSTKLDEKYRTLKEQVRSRHEASWQAMAGAWHEGIRHAALEVDWVERQSAGYCPRWDDPVWPSRALPRDLPPALRFGEVAARPGRPAGRHLGRPPAHGRRTHSIHPPRAAAVPVPGQPAHRVPARGTRRGPESPPGVDVPAAHQPAAGPGAVHDHRPGRDRPELRRVHAPGRLRRCPGQSAGLDRPPPDRGATGRAGGAHGDGHAEIPAERVRDARGVQRGRRRGRRALSRRGDRRFPGEDRREGRGAAGGDRIGRRALRRADAGGRRHLAAPAIRLLAR